MRIPGIKPCRAVVAFPATSLLSAILLMAPSGSLQAHGAPVQEGKNVQPRLVIADQDGSGPGGSDMAALLVLLQSPRAKLLGITIVTGDMQRDAEVVHTLRLLESVGRTDVKVYPGAASPLLRTREWTQLQAELYGKVVWNGAWTADREHSTDAAIPIPEGAPLTKAAEEDAAHFLVRTVRQFPHKVTIYAAGPLTNIALAVRLEPHFAELAEELVLMGGSLSPRTNDPEFINNPRHEFNFWFDPEAASIVLNAPFPKITATTVDASVQTRLSGVLAALQSAKSPAARYLRRYAGATGPSDYAWDELAAAAWLDPAIVTQARDVYVDVDTSKGPSYGNALTWTENDKPALPHRLVHAQTDVDAKRLERDLIELYGAATPGAQSVRPLP